ncbi:MAG TPA: hypothetical protein VF642_01820 [Propionibacteriaceae bacterium]
MTGWWHRLVRQGRDQLDGLADQGRDQAERLVGTLRLRQLPSYRPLPRVRVALGPWVPGWALRLVQAVVALCCVALLQPGAGTWFLGVAGAFLLVLRPSGIVAACFAAAVGLRLAVISPEPYAVTSFLLLFGVHLLVQLARAGSAVPWAARVELRVLLPTVLRFMTVQALAQLLALSGAALTSQALALPWVPVLVGAALAVLGWGLLSQLTRSGPG